MKLTSGVAQRSRRERALVIVKRRIANWEEQLGLGITKAPDRNRKSVKITAKLAQANKELTNLENKLSNGY